MEYIKSSGAGAGKMARQLSSELSESSLSFLKTKSSFVTEVARLGKFWMQSIFFSEYVYGKSLIFEVLAVASALEVERKGGSSVFKAFETFLNKV